MIEDFVTSFFEGRVRLRHPLFKDVELAAELQVLLQNIPGMESLQYNARTGSFLLEYDPEILDQDTLTSLLQEGEKWLAQNESLLHKEKPTKSLLALPSFTKNLTTREKRKLFNRTMAVFYGMTILSLGVGSERTHVIAGSVFLGLSLWHIKRMRKALK